MQSSGGCVQRYGQTILSPPIDPKRSAKEGTVMQAVTVSHDPTSSVGLRHYAQFSQLPIKGERGQVLTFNFWEPAPWKKLNVKT